MDQQEYQPDWHNLPWFEEHNDIPDGWGIEHSHDNGFYPYYITADGPLAYIKDEKYGLDLCCATRDEALAAIMEEVSA